MDGFLAVLKKANPNLNILKEFIEVDFPQWEGHIREAKWLIDSFETEMSPISFFKKEPLNRMKTRDQKWVKKLLHDQWLHRHSIQQKVSTARENLERANTVYKELSKKIKEVKNSPDKLKKMIAEFNKFRSACSTFSKSLSQFPKRIL